MTASPGLPGCYRHPDRPTGLRCTRCDKPACPECLREASVGYQCLDCVTEGARTIRRPVTVAGAQLVDRSVLVPALIVINVVIFGVTAFQAHSILNNYDSQLFSDWALTPGLAGPVGEWWRLFTAGFMHIGPLHLLVNMASLWMIGRDLERVLGRARFLAVYALSMVGGGIGVFLFGAVNGPVAGASTALYGLLGAILVTVLKLKLNPRTVLLTIGINLILTISIPGISLLGHVGGLVTGTIAMAAIVYAPERNRNLWQVGTMVAIALLLLALFWTRDLQLIAQYCTDGVCT